MSKIKKRIRGFFKSEIAEDICSVNLDSLNVLFLIGSGSSSSSSSDFSSLFGGLFSSHLNHTNRTKNHANHVHLKDENLLKRYLNLNFLKGGFIR